MFPEAAPLAPDVNLAFLAHQFELTGGQIRNCALAAAFLAAAGDGVITSEHLVLAVGRELLKEGRLPSASQFRDYYELVRSER